MLHKGALVQVVLIYGPQHILGGMVAADRKIQDNPELRRLFVFRQNWLSEEKFNSMAEDCKRILGPRHKDFYPVYESNWEEFMSELEKSICVEHEVGTKIEFLFPHDVVTDTVKSIMSCLGKVRVICFGDGMGTVFSRNRIIISRLTGIKRIKKRLAFFFVERDFLRKVEIFHLMLPVVESKIKRVTAKVQIPDKISVQRTINALCLESKDAMSEFFKTQMDQDTAVVCLENLTESKFSDFDKEIQLYVHFISTLNSKYKRVYLKPHPLQEMSKVELIAAAISDRDVLILPESLSRTPVEYWPLEDFKGKICSMGVPNISLKYLYNLSVSNPASEEVIREFIENSYQESFFWVEEQLKRIKLKLENWDGASILFVQR